LVGEELEVGGELIVGEKVGVAVVFMTGITVSTIFNSSLVSALTPDMVAKDGLTVIHEP